MVAQALCRLRVWGIQSTAEVCIILHCRGRLRAQTITHVGLSPPTPRTQCPENSHTNQVGSRFEAQCLTDAGFGWDDGAIKICDYGARPQEPLSSLHLAAYCACRRVAGAGPNHVHTPRSLSGLHEGEYPRRSKTIFSNLLPAPGSICAQATGIQGECMAAGISWSRTMGSWSSSS
jgi:hypothetical protein